MDFKSAAGRQHPQTPKSSELSAAQLLRKMRAPDHKHESEYPYCKLPPHFFEHRLAALSGGAPGKSGLVVEVTRR